MTEGRVFLPSLHTSRQTGSRRADQVDESRRAIKSWFYNVAAERAGLPADCDLFPLAKGEYPMKTNSSNNELEDDEGEFIGAKRVVKPVDKGNIKIDTENINKIDLPGACRREEKGPVKPNPHLPQDLGGMVWCLFGLCSIILAHSGLRERNGSS